jgi:MFS transporter, FSR family, fosmidomycin resistance protein
VNAPSRDADFSGPGEATALATLLAISFAHLLNDAIQSLIAAIYPLLKDSFALDFTEIGIISLAFQITASLLQPVVGTVTDRWPQPWSLPVGMGFTLAGLVVLAFAPNYLALVGGSVLVGFGSAIFHPESSRVARLASGGRYGLAQSIFQVGGNVGTAIGPLLAAIIVVPFGQSAIAWFSVAAILGMVVLYRVSNWYSLRIPAVAPRSRAMVGGVELPGGRVVLALAVLTLLIFSKFFYLACLTNYFTFYLIDRFAVSVQESQVLLFVFLFAVAAGTVIGGPIGDRFGRKVVIWFSILGALPFTIALPYASLFWTVALSVVIGLIISSAFSAMVVLAHGLMPGRVGMVSGMFFGLAFGLGGIGAALLGVLADQTSIEFVFEVCSYLPAIGILTIFLPEVGGHTTRRT